MEKTPKPDEQLVPPKRMKDMAVVPGDPKEDGPKEDGPKEDGDDIEAEDAPRDEHNLNEGLEDSMDASDPPSSIQP